MTPLIAWVRACTLDYWFWLKAPHLDANVRGWNMHRDRRDWELAAVLYKSYKRKAGIIKDEENV